MSIPELSHSAMPDDAASRLQSLLDAMPPVAALGVRVTRCDAERVVLEAPLALNVNDKACAFGGSLASLLTLAGWGALESALHARGVKAEVYVADSTLKYHAPLYADLVAVADVPDAEALDALMTKLAQRGRGGIVLEAAVRDAEGQPVTTFTARYAAVASR
ncbi:MAG: YiiD C-terminal domain-containing protein [Silanimonas sp.]|nr:YiiD C-terminal domain-containing protein [Silanimonas sp.]